MSILCEKNIYLVFPTRTNLTQLEQYAFCQRQLQLSRNRMRMESTSFSFQVKRSILLKKKNMRGRRTCWVKKGRTSAWWDKFLNKEVIDNR